MANQIGALRGLPKIRQIRFHTAGSHASGGLAVRGRSNVFAGQSSRDQHR